MNKNILIIALLLCVGEKLQSQSLQWAAQIGGPNGGSNDFPNEWVKDMRTDAQGNVYICGRVGYNAQINGQPLNLYINNSYSLFLAKLDCSGNVLWIKTAGGPNLAKAEANCLELDHYGNIYLSGQINVSPINNNFVYFLDSTITENTTDMFLAKFDTAGNFKWVKWAAPGNPILNSRGIKMQMDGNNRINLLGNGSIAGLFFPGFNFITDSGGVFFAQFDTSGQLLYLKHPTLKLTGIVLDYKLSPAGDQYITGYFSSDSMVIGNQVLYKLSTGTRTDLFLAKFDSAGSFDWAFNYGTNKFMMGFGVTATATEVALTGTVGNNYTIGSTTLTNPIAPSANSYFPFIATYDVNGNLNGVVPVYTQYAASEPTAGITRMTNQSLAISGWFAGIAIAGQDTLYAQGLGDMFIVTANSNLVFSSSEKIECTGSSNERPQCITSDTFGNVYVGGAFDGTLTVNGSSYTASGTSDGFVVKYGFNCTTGIEEEPAAAQQDGLLIYPNPATDVIYISNTTGKIEKAELYNLLGEKVISQKTTRSLSRLSFAISALPSGIYLVAVYKTNGERMAAKVMVQRE